MKRTGINFVGCLLLLLSHYGWAGIAVTDIAAEYRNGQVFITWTCPEGTGYMYKLYRSTNKLNNKEKIKNNKYIGGYVIDSSSMNTRLTRKTGTQKFFIIQDGQEPLQPNQGLYVITCDKEANFYYAVTVTELATGIEYKKITLGENSLNSPVAEHVSMPQPVLQEITTFTTTGETVYRYAQFGDHRNLPHYPYMFNQGSYGFNFNLVYRGNYDNKALYVFYEGLDGNAFVGNGLDSFEEITDCIIICLDDWLPVPNGFSASSGVKTFWSGYHENFNPYASDNGIPDTGTVRMYQQHRYIHTIQWANQFLPIDSNQVNLVGVSAGGFGALLTAVIVPEKINTVYSICAPVLLKSYPLDEDDTDEQLWGVTTNELKSDIYDQYVGDPYPIFDLLSIKTMMNVRANDGLPIIYTVHGKNDNTVFWTDKPNYLKQNENYWQGGIHYWDQREHDGSDANFFDSETTPPFLEFRRNKSYPAFSNCDVNEDPGDGDPAVGDQYGSYSGYIDFDSITEDACKWTCSLDLTEFMVGGNEINPDYKSCFADVTLRRLQAFNPSDGDTIKWTNYDSEGVKIKGGSFAYLEGTPITIPAVKVKRNGNRLEVKIKNCNKREEEEVEENPIPPNASTLQILNTYNGWMVHFNSEMERDGELRLLDSGGRLLSALPVSVAAGWNTHFIPAPHHGNFVIQLIGQNSREARSVIF